MALSRIVGIRALVVFGEKADETLILGASRLSIPCVGKEDGRTN